VQCGRVESLSRTGNSFRATDTAMAAPREGINRDEFGKTLQTCLYTRILISRGENIKKRRTRMILSSSSSSFCTRINKTLRNRLSQSYTHTHSYIFCLVNVMGRSPIDVDTRYIMIFTFVRK
jgi:hypothetical protein